MMLNYRYNELIMALSIGIVGLPNVGKSTLFNALVKNRQAQASNFAFCTIDPNVGIVNVPDPRLNRLYDIIAGNTKSESRNTKQIQIPNDQKNETEILNQVQDDNGKRLPKIIPATVEFIDIAGLVKEAHKGEGLGNKFLSHIRETDAICMVLRCFEDPNVMHVEGKIDPKDDFEVIKTELELADIETKEKVAGKIRKGKVDEGTIQYLAKKPVIYAANVSEDDAGKTSERLEKVRGRS